MIIVFLHNLRKYQKKKKKKKIFNIFFQKIILEKNGFEQKMWK